MNAVKGLYHKWFDDSLELHSAIASVKAENTELKKKFNENAKNFAEKAKKMEAETLALKKDNEFMKAKLEKIEKFIERTK